jgi:hypothetical protein
LPASALGDFVRSLAHRIAGFPAAGHIAIKERVNAIALAPLEDFRLDSDRFGEGARNPESQNRTLAAMKHPRRRRSGQIMRLSRVGPVRKLMCRYSNRRPGQLRKDQP